MFLDRTVGPGTKKKMLIQEHGLLGKITATR